MQFNSVAFLFCFFPLFLAVYYLIPGSLKNWVMVLASLLFYYQGGSNKVLVLGLLVGTKR